MIVFSGVGLFLVFTIVRRVSTASFDFGFEGVYIWSLGVFVLFGINS